MSHVRGQYTIDHVLADEHNFLLVQRIEQICLGRLFQKPEGLRDVVVLEHTAIVVRQGKMVLHIRVEGVVAPVMAHVVDHGAQQQGEAAERAEVLAKAEGSEQCVHGVGDISRMQAVVVRHRFAAGVAGLHTSQEAMGLVNIDVELREEATLAQGLPAHKLQGAAGGEVGEVEDIEAPGAEVGVHEGVHLHLIVHCHGVVPPRYGAVVAETLAAGRHRQSEGRLPRILPRGGRRVRVRGLRRVVAAAVGADEPARDIGGGVASIGHRPTEQAARQRRACGACLEALSEERNLGGVVVRALE
mmetsp:Transcript_93515/g.243819  ORF Transcript_93515/g.243819 Transcript_93515/m.243819 type:complete len:301 (-) Transcript_93515:242-1144(-)